MALDYITINGFKEHRHNYPRNKLRQYMGVNRYCLSFSFYKQLKLPFLTNLTEGVFSGTGKILDS